MPVGDAARNKLIAYGIVAALVGVMAVLGVRSVSGPQLYKGDKLETMTCRICNGTGQVGGERCKGCLGAKKVKVIVPGPEHPVEVRGTVRDAGAFKDREEAQQQADAEPYKAGLNVVKGAVHGATIRFAGADNTIKIDGKATGRYRCALKPGNYKVTVEAEGFSPYQQQLTVEPLKDPVWPDMPGVPDDDHQSLDLNLILER